MTIDIGACSKRENLAREVLIFLPSEVCSKPLSQPTVESFEALAHLILDANPKTIQSLVIHDNQCKVLITYRSHQGAIYSTYCPTMANLLGQWATPSSS